MPKKNGTISFNKSKMNGANKIKSKISLIDLAIKKSIWSKRQLLNFFRGKIYNNYIIYYFKQNRLYYII